MSGHGWAINGLCIAGIIGCLVMVPKENTVTAPRVQPVVLADGMWSNHVNALGEFCVAWAMIEGIDAEEITAKFNQCLLEQGVTI